MNITLIAVAAVLSPYLAEGTKELTKEAAKTLWAWVKDKFTTKNKEHVLRELEENQSDPDTQAVARHTLKDIFKENPELEKELLEMIGKMRAEGQIIQLKVGDIEVKENKFKNNGDVIIGGIKNG